MYRKHFKRDRPETVISIEEKVDSEHGKKLERRAKKQAAAAQTGETRGEPNPTNPEANQ